MTSHSRKFLVFSIQGSLFALDLSQVAEVCEPPQMWPIPLAPACYSGTINFHGDIIAVMNLSIFLGLGGYNHSEKIIILHQNVASLAFFVDATLRIIPEEDVSITFGPRHDSEYAAATLGLSDGKAILLDLDLLVHKAELGMQKNQ